MKKIFMAISFLIAFTSANFAQVEGTQISIGTNHTIISKVLNQDRAIQVHLPASYKTLTKKYPVLYILDGQEHFLAAVAFQRMLKSRDKFPEFIIVGVNTDRQKRRALFLEDAQKTIDFLQQELIPFIDSNFQTSKENERIFFGWEMAGGLGVQILAEKPTLFSGFIIASPSHLTEKRYVALDKMIKNQSDTSKKYLLVTTAPGEDWIVDDEKLRSYFSKKQSYNSKWRFAILDREVHHSTPFKSINEGITDYFEEYKPINFRNLKEYEDYGGLEALKSFYKKRGQRFGISTEIDRSTMMFILYYAVLENNYTQFEYYEKAFKGHIESNSRDSWFNRYGQFYLKHKNTKKAMYVFKYGIDKIPNSALLYQGLGDVYVNTRNLKKAREAYQKSLEINANQPKLIAKMKSL